MGNHTLQKSITFDCIILSTKSVHVVVLAQQSVHPMRVHNPEYQPPLTFGSRVTGCTNFVNLSNVN